MVILVWFQVNCLPILLLVLTWNVDFSDPEVLIDLFYIIIDWVSLYNYYIVLKGHAQMFLGHDIDIVSFTNVVHYS